MDKHTKFLAFTMVFLMLMREGGVSIGNNWEIGPNAPFSKATIFLPIVPNCSQLFPIDNILVLTIDGI